MKIKKIDYRDLPWIIRRLYRADHGLSAQDRYKLSRLVRELTAEGAFGDTRQDGLNSLPTRLWTALVACEEIGVRHSALIGMILAPAVRSAHLDPITLPKLFDRDVIEIIDNLNKISEMYERSSMVTSENFSHFLLSFAGDIRVIMIIIADRLVKMRLAETYMEEKERAALAVEVSYFYAPLAHRLGLYGAKSEMEDLVLKYTDRPTYNFVKNKLNETKRSRDAYIHSFIEPVKKRLNDAGLTFEIKGRTKSISSIRNKLKKQNIEFEAIYDLFAIRIVLDTPPDKERSSCWQVYSIITDMYQPNPKRLKDWISIPKSNGYESLHITVMGPENKWVEVQIRTKRMDEIAEKGLAAHWRYKGIKPESGLDEFLNGVRRVLESKETDDEEIVKDFKLDLYDKEIYVFTPKGDLVKLPRNATVLDFAFAIHSGLGMKCVSGMVNGKNVSIRHVLHNGDSVSIVTANVQQPKADWLQFVVTSKARVKIKQSLREQSAKTIKFAKEEFQRKLKNRKLEYDDAVFNRLVKKKGYKTGTDFFLEMEDNRLDLNAFFEDYRAMLEGKDHNPNEGVRGAADEFLATTEAEQQTQDRNVLLIDKNLSGIEYKLAKCCNPIFGDAIFAFTSRNGLTIHRMDCPNAHDLFTRYGYRVLQARWSGKGSSGYEVGVRIVGNDDISIVTNISGQIEKEDGVSLRRFNIESNDGLFIGYFTVYVKSLIALNSLMKKLKGVKGVKQVQRIESALA